MYWWFGGVLLGAILGAPFLIAGNSLAQSMFGLLTTVTATAVGIFATWKYSQKTKQEELTRYGLLAWRNIDALSVKIQQQIAEGEARTDVLESWLLDVDQAKWAWRDLLRELFELQKRLEAEREEVAIKYKAKMDEASSEADRRRLERELRVELAKIGGKAPLPLRETEDVLCPNCGQDVQTMIGSDVGSTSWPNCGGCGATFPVHRKGDSEIVVNEDAVKLPVNGECPHCGAEHTWKVPAERSIRFRYTCNQCDEGIQCLGDADDFSVEKVQ
ncbi:hypothetical protein P1P91_06410 [Halomonas piscis]|uniref:Uncharacterized protein n=1 Tax=Halomonas piscis TaxID=3031727 RepID=A0ABY9Z2D6_9GAMM|nr:hypothetical protein [Halomonas piscis]WNK21302.1 hypothetical protein P1P91_06410 [Halomonas piscis]